MHAVFGVERSRQVRKMRTFTRFWRILSIISLGLQKFRRLNAISVALYTPNATHAVFSDETSPTVRKLRPLTRFCRKLCGISILLGIFLRLNAISIAFYTPNAMHAVLRFDTCPTVRKMRPFTPFWRKLSVISILFEIFRRLKATSIAFYTSNAMHASSIVEVKQTCAKNASICSILKKTERYFACVGDISTFKCSFHRTLHAECYARQFHHLMNQTFTKNAIMYSILKKTVRHIAPVGNISTFKLYFQCILHTDSYARRI